MTNINILKHTHVPEHTVLSAEEKKKLLDELNISDVQLPSINAKDPVVKLLKTQAGDVIKITRASKTQKYVIYRRVI